MADIADDVHSLDRPVLQSLIGEVAQTSIMVFFGITWTPIMVQMAADQHITNEAGNGDASVNSRVLDFRIHTHPLAVREQAVGFQTLHADVLE